MSFTDQTNEIRYAGPIAISGTAAIPFKWMDDAAINAKVVDTGTVDNPTVLAITTNFTLTGEGDDAGGEMTMVTAVTAAQDLVIWRDEAYTQETEYVEDDEFPSLSHEDAIDKLTILTIQNKTKLARIPQFTEGSATSGISLPVPEDGKALQWSGNALVNTDVDPDDFSGIAASAAAAASNAGISAASAAALASNASAAATSAATAAASAIAAVGDVQVSSNDTTPATLIDKISNSTGISLTVINSGADETLIISNTSVAASSVLSNQGDILYMSGAHQNLAIGTNSQIMRTDGNKPVWGGELPSLTTQGDIPYLSGAIQGLTIGTNSQILKSDGNKPVWATDSGGGSTSYAKAEVLVVNRNTNTPGSQVVGHTLSAVPKIMFFSSTTTLTTTPGSQGQAIRADDGTIVNTCTYERNDGSVRGSSSQGMKYQPTSGNEFEGAAGSFTNSGFTITWVQNGSPSSEVMTNYIIVAG